MNLPNIISLIRLVILPVILYLMYVSGAYNLYIAFILTVIGCFSDSLDGAVARALKKETALGAMLDQMADKIFVTSILLMMVIMRWIQGIDIIPVFVVLFRDFAISGLRQCYEIKSDPLGKFKTIMLTATILMVFVSVVIMPIYYLERVALWISCGLTVGSFLNYVRYV